MVSNFSNVFLFFKSREHELRPTPYIRIKYTGCCIQDGPSHHTEKYALTLKSGLAGGCCKILLLLLPFCLSARSLAAHLSARTGQRVQALSPPARESMPSALPASGADTRLLRGSGTGLRLGLKTSPEDVGLHLWST